MRRTTAVFVIVLTILSAPHSVALNSAIVLDRGSATAAGTLPVPLKTPSVLDGPCTVSPSAPAVPSTDTVWIEDAWSNPGPPPDIGGEGWVWPVDTTKRASGSASFPASLSPNNMGAHELIANFAEPFPMPSPSTFVAYTLISNCDPPARGIGVEIALDDFSLRYYWGEQVVFPQEVDDALTGRRIGSATVVVQGPPVRLGDVPPAGQWARLEMPESISGPVPSISGLRLISDGQARVWWDHIGSAATAGPPHVTTIDPRYGAAGGGTSVRIIGSGFVAGDTEVYFGATAAAATTYASETKVIATTPPGTATVDVQVVTGRGASTLANAFTYLAPPTIATSTRPSKGSSAGNQTIVVDGTNFVDGETTASFGNKAAAEVAVLTGTRLHAVTPPHSPGVTDVAVTTPGGTATLAGGFRYFDPPAIAAFSPPHGTAGANVSISGTNFDSDPGGNTVAIAGALAPVVSASATQLVATVPAGAPSGRISVMTAGGTALSATAFTVSRYAGIVTAPSSVSLLKGASTTLAASGVLPGGTTEPLSSGVSWSTADASVASVDNGGVVTGVAQGSTTITATYPPYSASTTVTVSQANPLPPDPVQIAPPLDMTVGTNLYDATRFLYSGANAIQTGVTEVIEARRVSVVRGRVLTRDGTPLPGVRVISAENPGLGRTLTRADGGFDFVLNGGGSVVIALDKEGYLPAERTLDSEWQDYAAISDIVMLQLDERPTRLELAASAMQVARGGAVADANGQRQSTLLFPAGTTATMIMADGSERPLPSITLRSTEYTVGVRGPQAMPADLPPQSGYTYCVELSSDEAIAAGARTVRFNQPVFHYVENFLGFPVGGVVPTGYYDRLQHAWIGAPNGRVIRIVEINAASALVDITGDGVADDSATLATIGLTVDEQQHLAALYGAGQSVWRVPIPHLTPWDYNWPFGPPADAVAPANARPVSAPHLQDAHCQSGSVIDCENLVIGESIPITGTPYALHYRSDRVGGRKAAYEMKIAVTGPTVSASMRRVVLHIEVAGKTFTREFPPQPNLSYTFIWDGRDAYGRTVQGRHAADVNIGYVYPARYQEPAFLASSFAQFSGTVMSGDQSRVEITLWQQMTNIAQLGVWQQTSLGFGGWSLTPHHTYIPSARSMMLGDGRQQNVEETKEQVVRRAGGAPGWPHGIPAAQARLASVGSVAYAPDGTLYILHGARVSRVDPAGFIWDFVSRDGIPGYRGDGGSSMDARIDPSMGKLAVGRDGSVYLADSKNARVRRIDRNGIITTIAGNDRITERVDGVDATLSFVFPVGLATASDGSLYIGDPPYIRRVTPDGIITTVAGSGQYPARGAQAQGAPARQTAIGWPESLHFDGNGALLIVDAGRILRLGPDGRISNIAGRYAPTGDPTTGDGGPANSATLTWPNSAIPMPDGGILVAQDGYLRRISAEGVITRFAGSVAAVATAGSLLNTRLPRARAALSPDGELAVGLEITSFSGSSGILAGIAPLLPGYNGTDFVIPDATGSLLHGYDAAGRHVKTLNADRITPELEFEYGPDGLLQAIRDRIGNRTTIERLGTTVRITAPRGRITTLTIGADGYLERVRTPAGRETLFDYDAEGRLTSTTSPEGRTTSFSHDAGGLLARHTSAGTKHRTLQRTANDTTATATVRTGMGRVWSYVRTRLTSGTRQIVTDAAGSQTIASTSSDAATRARTTPDGHTITVTKEPDQRFGMAMPVFSASSRLPSGLQASAVGTRTFSFVGQHGSSDISERVDTVTINGKTHRRTYTLGNRTVSWVSPGGRVTTATLDAQHRVTRVEIPGIAPVTLTYDPVGRMQSVSQDVRSMTMTYDASDLVMSMSDQFGRSASFVRDADGLVQSATSKAGTTGFKYDRDGNLLSVTVTDGVTHTFTYTAAGAPESYTPPGGAPTRYRYDADDTISSILFPTDTSIEIGYDTGGRPLTISTAVGLYVLQYAADGTLAAVTAPGAVTTAYADDGGLLKAMTWSGPVTGAVSFTYDADLRMQSEAVADKSIMFTYDSDGLLTAAGALSLRRDAQTGLLTGTTLGELVDSWAYNAFAEPVQYSATAGGSAVYTTALTRSLDGRIAAVTDTIAGLSATREYTYDDGGRLTRVSIGASAIAEYDYDARGNRIAYRAAGVTLTASYDQQDRLLRYGDTMYTYTASGYLRTKSLAGATIVYDYDDLGNLRDVALPSRNIQYLVDGQQRRIGKRIDGTLVQGFLYSDQLRVAAELDGENHVVSRFVYGERNNAPEYMMRGDMTYRFILDHLGSPRLVVNAATGAVAQRIDYDEFGNVLSDTNPGFQPFGLAGGLYDRDTGFVRFGARDYDPATGRWTAKDPIGFAGGDTNLYAYVRNNPVNLIDPSGLLFGGTVNAGEAYGQAALTQYADIMTDPTSAWYEIAGAAIGGFFSALWTPCTSDATFTTLSTATGVSAGLRAAGQRAAGRQFSHWVPDRYLKKTGSDLIRNDFGYSPLNGNYVSRVEHALSDPYAYRFMPRAWKEANPMPSRLVQQWNRIPKVYEGAAAGGAVGALAEAPCGC